VAGAPYFGQFGGFGTPCGTSITCPQLLH